MFGLIDATGGVKQLAFEKRVVQDVQHATPKAQRHQARCSPGQAQYSNAKTNAGNAHVLCAGVAQHAFQVALAHGVQATNDRRCDREGDQRPAHPGIRLALNQQKVQQREQTGLVDHTRHQCAYIGGRSRVGARQPRVKREESRFQPEAGQQQQKHRIADGARVGAHPVAKVVQVPALRLGIQNHERSHQKNQADVGGHQIVEAGKANLLVGVIPDHQ